MISTKDEATTTTNMALDKSLERYRIESFKTTSAKRVPFKELNFKQLNHDNHYGPKLSMLDTLSQQLQVTTISTPHGMNKMTQTSHQDV